MSSLNVFASDWFESVSSPEGVDSMEGMCAILLAIGLFDQRV
jgi:hypothetical protein